MRARPSMNSPPSKTPRNLAHPPSPHLPNPHNHVVPPAPPAPSLSNLKTRRRSHETKLLLKF